MLIGIGIFFGLMGLGSFCWLLFGLYVYCLPVMVGIAAGFAAYYTGAGLFGAFLVGLIIAILTLVAGRTVIKTSRSPVIRAVTVLLFVVPALWAGYSVTLEFVRWLEVPSVVWQYVYALFGAFIVGGTAFVHLTDPDPPEWLRPDCWD
jgi:hypothetical protein